MNDILRWLLEGDITIQFMTHKLLVASDPSMLERLQGRIATEGFGERFLSFRNDDGHWGLYYYQPKWTSTHYSLLDMKNVSMPQTVKPCGDMVIRMLDECMQIDGGMNLSKHEHSGDICVDGMVLNYASYFCPDEPRLIKLATHLLSSQKPDGGFTWDVDSDKGDPHTTICVLEGLWEYCCGLHRVEEVETVKAKAVEFLLSNNLFIDSADKRFLKLSYPYRYRYDLLRALEYFACSKTPYDIRMKAAFDWLLSKRRGDGRWYLENQHKGNVHFAMEELRGPSRFITLKALYILKQFDL
jgi:hypothetical protein